MKRLKKHVARKLIVLGKRKLLKPKDEAILREFLDKVNK
jgi:hypothetical protein